MKRAIVCMAGLAVFLFNCVFCFAGQNKWTALVEESGTVLSQIQSMPDQNIPDDLLKKCSAVAIFPNTISAGLGIGGKFGQGIVMARNENTGSWSAPAIFNLVGGSLGWQIGGQATDIILLFMNKRGVDGLLKSKFKIGGDMSVSAGPVGRSAEAATDAQLKGGILSYSRSRGLFAGVKLEGAVMNANQEGNIALYQSPLSAKEILLENKAAAPKEAGAILSELGKYPYKRQ